MRISVITPVYNGEKYIERCIQSVIAQDYEDYEHVIIDGQSRDGTLSVVKRYDGRVRVVSEPDDGMYDAINKGIAIATGEVLTYINADDYYLNNKVLSSYAGKFLTGADICIGGGIFINPMGELIGWNIPFGIRTRYFATLGLFFIQPTLFWRSELSKVVGPFNGNYKYAGDLDMAARLFMAARKHALLPECVVAFEWRADSFGGLNEERGKAEAKKIRDRIAFDILHMSRPQLFLMKLLDKILRRLYSSFEFSSP